MAGVYSITEYGIVATCTGGTGTLILTSTPTSGLGASIKVCGSACGGSATADVVTIYNGSTNTANNGAAATSNGTLFFSGVGSTSGGLVALNLAMPVRLTLPITITFVGGTNGQAILYTPSSNS
jgi:hypothetical protein